MRVWRPLRRHQQIHQQRIGDVKIRGLEYVREAIEQKHGVLITPNHPGHGDSYLLWDAVERLPEPSYVMTAWQVFEMASSFERIVYRHHGAFSVNREGNDLQAYRQAVKILETTSRPLVIFPEGEVYHLNERVTPFKEGTAAMALSAAKRGNRTIMAIPCALKYRYVKDPTPELEEVMSRLEERLYWRPRNDLPLAERIYRFAGGLLELKEIEYLGSHQNGPLPDRLESLSDAILKQVEARYGIHHGDRTIPERVAELRQQAVRRQSELAPDDPQQADIDKDLDDLFGVVQLFSYPGDYVAERPTIERMAETVDKFEEDFLDMPTARIRGEREATVTFGEPVAIASTMNKGSAKMLTRELEGRVQALLDERAEATPVASATA